jgi:hypothetical protein
MYMGQSNISEQAEKYAEVIVGQIAGNFTALNFAVENCDDFQKAQKKYDALDAESIDELTLKTAKDKMDIIQDTIGSSFCSDKTSAIEPLAVGLFGEWGSGKTHQLKLIQERIKRIQTKEYTPKENESTFPKKITSIPIFFNAWRFEKEEHIILPLFQTLLDALENHERTLGEKAKRALKPLLYHMKNVLFSLHKGIKPLSVAKTIRGVVTGDVEDLAEVHNLVSTKDILDAGKEKTNEEQVNNQSLTELLKSDPLQSIYLNIPQWIEKITLFENVNFVFLIDDLDRCLPENTLKMLESIKLFLDVPSCAFVLAVDDDVVERGVVHHYRDYLQQNNNTIIYMNKEDEENTKSNEPKMQELPITGHEYLEKMIQLPLRLPTPNTSNVRSFLADHSDEWKKLVNKDFDTHRKPRNEEILNGEPIKSPYDELMDFFVKSIPPKPRKIKRVALLFESKLQLMDALELKVDPMLLAKIVLLELFSPKLLRFMQGHHKYYESLFARLEEFRFAGKEDGKNSLEDDALIITYIKSKKYTEKFEKMYFKMFEHIKEHYSGRVRFELDNVFDGSYKDVAALGKNLQYIMECSQDIVYDKKEEKFIYSKNFKTLLFSDDRTSWNDAFKEDNLFAEGKAILTNDQLASLLDDPKAKELRKNASWLTVLAQYATIEQVKQKGFLYFEMQKTTVTFDDYEKYCKDVKISIPDDSGFGKGKRPVINVSWNDATAYAKWLSNKASIEEGEKVEYKLPTEDEWYLACNAGAKTKWHFGDDKKLLHKYAWYDENSYDLGKGHKDYGTHEVRNKDANALGLYDMHGNVWEWCEDWYDEEKKYKVLRGGSWGSNSSYTHSTDRSWSIPSSGNYYVGFRLQRTLLS